MGCGQKWFNDNAENLNELSSDELIKKQQELEAAHHRDEQIRNCFNNHWKETAEYLKETYPEEFI